MNIKNKIHIRKLLPDKLNVVACLWCIVCTLIITYPVFLDLDSWVVLSAYGKYRQFPDQIIQVGYIGKIAAALKDGGSVSEILFRDPDYAVSPFHVIPGGILSIFVSPRSAHNLICSIFIFLSLLTVYQLSFFFCRSVTAAMYASMSVGASNFIVHHYIDGHGNIIQLFWVPLLLLNIERLLAAPGPGRAFIFGLLMTGLFVSCEQVALYFIVLLPLYLFLHPKRPLGSAEHLKYFFIAVFIAGVFYLPYFLLRSGYEPAIYGKNINMLFSVRKISDLVRTDAEANLGLVPLILAIASIFLVQKSKMLDILPLYCLMVLTIILMFGPFHPFAPYTILMEYFPYFDHVRTPVRYFTISIVMVSILSSCLIASILDKKGIMTRYMVIIAIFSVSIFSYQQQSIYFSRSKDGVGIWTYGSVNDIK